jgi:hypothetical protein
MEVSMKKRAKLSPRETVCEFCGKKKPGLSFFIGATPTPDWCMIEGTGKISCPDCHDRAQAEAHKVIEAFTGLKRGD